MLIRFLGLVFGLERAIVCTRLNNNIWPGGQTRGLRHLHRWIDESIRVTEITRGPRGVSQQLHRCDSRHKHSATPTQVIHSTRPH